MMLLLNVVNCHSYLNSGYFWPGCFAKGDELDNLMISSLGNYGTVSISSIL